MISDELQPAQDAALSPLHVPATQTALVTEEIRKAILEGKLKPQEVLVERRIADMLGVSKTPVREALIALAATGLVDVSGRRGMRVRKLDARALRKIYELRLLLEPWAISSAARTRPKGPLDAAREALNHAEAERLNGPAGQARLSVINRQFHRALYSACPNELVVARIDEIQDLTALGIVHHLWKKWPSWGVEQSEHEEILAAVEKGDVLAVEELTRAHIRSSVNRLIESETQSLGDSGHETDGLTTRRPSGLGRTSRA